MVSLTCERAWNDFPGGKTYLIRSESYGKNNTPAIASIYVESDSYTITWKDQIDFSMIDKIALNAFLPNSKSKSIINALIVTQDKMAIRNDYDFGDPIEKNKHDITISKLHETIVFARYKIKIQEPETKIEYSFSASKEDSYSEGDTELGIKLSDQKELNTFLLMEILQNRNKNLCQNIDINKSIQNIHECLDEAKSN